MLILMIPGCPILTPISDRGGAYTSKEYIGAINRYNTGAPMLIIGNTWVPNLMEDIEGAIQTLIPNTRVCIQKIWGVYMDINRQ